MPKQGPKVVWMRNDGRVRIVHKPGSSPRRAELVVEGKGMNSMREEFWGYAELGQSENLEAFALALFGTPLPDSDGMSGRLL